MTWNLGDELHAQDVAHNEQLSFDFYKDEYFKDIDWDDVIGRTPCNVVCSAKLAKAVFERRFEDAMNIVGTMIDGAASSYAQDLFDLPKRGDE
jgi:hypothetical protein